LTVTINPLRYPGAKRKLVNYVEDLLLANNLQQCIFLEPYAGSAAVGLELLKRNIIRKLVLVEKDIMLYSFWRSVFKMPEALCDRIDKTPITIETWHKLNYLRTVSKIGNAPTIDLGFACLFFNRTNFSGILNANPIGGLDQQSQYKINCRFNKQRIIEVILNLSTYANRVEVYCDDALTFMKRNKPSFHSDTFFAYLDPPYYAKGAQVYRCYYTVNDHINLSSFVKNHPGFDWLISYDDDPFICGLYSGSGAKYMPFFLDYTAAKERSRGRELLISNLPLPPIQIQNAQDK
jgi:DNA adenine methylase